MNPALTDNDDRLLDLLQQVITFIVKADVPELSEEQATVLAAHLTGAVYVTIRGAVGDAT